MPDALALVIAWSLDEPDRVGELVLFPEAASEGRLIGRGAQRPDDPCPRATFVRQRPDGTFPTAPLSGPKISRAQLVVRARNGELLEIENIGQRPIFRDGEAVRTTQIRPGQTLQVGSQMLLLCVKRPLSGRRPLTGLIKSRLCRTVRERSAA